MTLQLLGWKVISRRAIEAKYDVLVGGSIACRKTHPKNSEIYLT